MKTAILLYSVLLICLIPVRAEAVYQIPTPADAGPCVNEDGSGAPLPCYWDRRTSGNGHGLSYWVEPDGVTIYDKRWTKRDGHINAQWELICPKGKHMRYTLQGSFESVRCVR